MAPQTKTNKQVTRVPSPHHSPNGAVHLASPSPLTLATPRFVAKEKFNESRIHALAMYCSDGRWGEAFDAFCQSSLKLPRYDRFAVPGGPAWLAQIENHHPELYYVTRRQLDFLVQVHGLERVVLITHYGCAFYGQQLHASPEACLEPQHEDVRLAAKLLRRWYRHLEVEAYLAMRSGPRGAHMSFHLLTT